MYIFNDTYRVHLLHLPLMHPPWPPPPPRQLVMTSPVPRLPLKGVADPLPLGPYQRLELPPSRNLEMSTITLRIIIPLFKVHWKLCKYSICIFVCLLHIHEIVEGLYFHCSLSVCVCVCLCVQFFLWTKFQPNGCTDLDAVFAKWLLTAMARTLLNLVTLGQRSRSQWRNTLFSS